MVPPRDQWCYLYAFVQPSSGRTWWLLLPTVSVAAFTLALAACAHTVGAGHDKHILLVLDRAGWHVSPQVPRPGGGASALPAPLCTRTATGRAAVAPDE